MAQDVFADCPDQFILQQSKLIGAGEALRVGFEPRPDNSSALAKRGAKQLDGGRPKRRVIADVRLSQGREIAADPTAIDQGGRVAPLAVARENADRGIHWQLSSTL